jgi:hypothetical protein
MISQAILENFDRLTRSTEDVQRLRSFAQALAVRGKFVEVNPNDEPASGIVATCCRRECPAV